MKKENMIFRLKLEVNELANDMVNQLPVALFKSNSTKFLDPSMGGGQFVAAIENRLRSFGHDDKNIKQRVFGIEKNQMRINYAINRNRLVGSYTIDKNDVPDIFESNMKFDCIVGNPPYQNGNEENQGSSGKLWMKFVEKSIETLNPNGYLCFVHPTAWRSVNHKLWSSIYQKTQVDYVKIEPEIPWNVGVKVDWYILKNADYSSPTLVEFNDGTSQTVDFREVDGIFNNNVVKKFVDYTGERIAFNQMHAFDSRRDFISETESATNSFPLRHTTPDSRLWASKKHPWQDKTKVLVSNSGYLYPRYDGGVLGTTQCCWAAFVKSKTEGEYIVRLLDSKLYKYFVANIKTSGFNNKLVKMFPYPKDLPSNFTDKDLYDHFKITEEEIKVIESSIKN